MVIDASDVRRRYGETVALDGVSFAVDAGEIFSLIGPNGAGKTTLIRALFGTTDAEGDISVFGRPPTEVERGRVGLLPQEFTPADRLTAQELIAYYAGLYDDARDPEAVLADVGLADSAGTFYENLSGGQKRRACVGSTLVNDPELLVLDEPTTGIDPTGRRELWRLIEGLADGGTTVLLTTHYMDEAEELADRVGLLADGKLVALGSPAELVERHGGDSRVVIEADDDRAGEDALRKAGYAPIDTGRHVSVPADATEIPAIVERLSEAGIGYEGVAWRQPSLDDAYATLTGTGAHGGLEDGGETPPEATTTDAAPEGRA
ncbi:ABC-type transport system ATP-binding protein [Natronomonas moolapensis 8.8.11]|uniref:ABC-type transport system ATP-binding protein n=1 Tax=Natronomonas moolapensis (strain DSM 18674 / CECT 7526 / JCM 14361 / 8.8.11) TaxID=268739 RepID=M1XLL3_NATM8|nr:ABC transporter ATP-binding protein [Natronomonas moolapensis]CCQ37923.1 ABC-type transport system ATP-binding protein [Natronomonas moolapensis 8.8.11]